jgi:hypothetical protein
MRQLGRPRHGFYAICLMAALGAVSAPLPAAAVEHLDNWDAFDVLIETSIATRPDIIYPPGDVAFTHTLCMRTFDASGFPGLTNTPPARHAGDVPVWTLHTVETNGWFLTASGGMVIHSNAVTAYDGEAWVRSRYGSPPRWITGDPVRLAEWYLDRRRERIGMSLAVVPEAQWNAYRAAMAAAAAGHPPPGAPAPVPPADTNRVAFALVAPSDPGRFGFTLYTPGDLPVDIFTRTNLAAGPLWNYAGTVQAAAPFTPAAVAAPHAALFLLSARGDIDTDGDGIPDGMELLHFGTDPLLWDTSGGGISDWVKIYRYGLDPLLRDSDGDGYPDDEELLAGTDPAQATPGAASGAIRYYRDADDRVTAAHTGMDGGAATAAPTPAGNPAVLQERSAP